MQFKRKEAPVIVSTGLDKATFNKLVEYCEKNNVRISVVVRTLITKELLKEN